MTPNSIDFKDECIFVQTTILMENPPYYSRDIVQESVHNHL